MKPATLAILRYFLDPKIMEKGDDFVLSYINKVQHDFMTMGDVAASEGVPREAFASLAAKHLIAVGYYVLMAMECPEEKLVDIVKSAEKLARQQVEAKNGN